MPATVVHFYEEEPGDVPVLDWLRELQRENRKAYAKCVERIDLLADEGFELRRPMVDILRDGIYELRARQRKIQYRILYFFHGQNVCILANACTKEDKVPDTEIERALARKKKYEANPDKHTFEDDRDEED